MKLAFKIVCMLVLLACLVNESRAQIIAITSDGKKVILSSDGTWKYEFEDNGKKVILNPDGTWKYETAKDTSRTVAIPRLAPVPPMSDSSRVVVKDSTKAIPVKPPVVKPPLNLDCSALVAVQRDMNSDSFFAESKKIRVIDDVKNGFTISWMNTKKGPLTWATTLTSGGYCIGEDNKITIVFKNGKRIQLPHDGKNNCNSTFTLYFGGIWGKEATLDVLKSTEISGVRVTTSSGFVDGNFSEEDSQRFRATLNCLVK